MDLRYSHSPPWRLSWAAIVFTRHAHLEPRIKRVASDAAARIGEKLIRRSPVTLIISRPALSGKPLSLASQGLARYDVEGFSNAAGA
jgi:hypothetical protein